MLHAGRKNFKVSVCLSRIAINAAAQWRFAAEQNRTALCSGVLELHVLVNYTGQ